MYAYVGGAGMRVGVIGSNHLSAPLSVREELVLACQRAFPFGIKEGVLLSTCNRLEIYFSGEDLSTAHTELLQRLRREGMESFEPYFYTFFGVECFAHLVCVTGGLDSVQVGETEIQRQVKEAYQMAGCVSSPMHYLFQKSFKLAKEMRSLGLVTPSPVSLPATLFALLEEMGCSSGSVLFIGNSAVNRKAMELFMHRGVDEISLMTRSTRDVSLGVPLLNFEQLSSWVEYDVVICGTRAADYLLHEEDLVGGRVPSLVIDLSVPRCVAPSLYPHVRLVDMEQINARMGERGLVEEMEGVKEWVWEKVYSYNEAFRERSCICL